VAEGEAAGGNVRRVRERWLPAGVKQAAGEAAPRDPGLDEGVRGRDTPFTLAGVRISASWPPVPDPTALGCAGWTVNEIPSIPDGN